MILLEQILFFDHSFHFTSKLGTVGHNPPQRLLRDAGYIPGKNCLDKLRLTLLRTILPGATHVSINTCPRCFLGARTIRP